MTWVAREICVHGWGVGYWIWVEQKGRTRRKSRVKTESIDDSLVVVGRAAEAAGAIAEVPEGFVLGVDVVGEVEDPTAEVGGSVGKPAGDTGGERVFDGEARGGECVGDLAAQE